MYPAGMGSPYGTLIRGGWYQSWLFAEERNKQLLQSLSLSNRNRNEYPHFASVPQLLQSSSKSSHMIFTQILVQNKQNQERNQQLLQSLDQSNKN